MMVMVMVIMKAVTVMMMTRNLITMIAMVKAMMLTTMAGYDHCGNDGNVEDVAWLIDGCVALSSGPTIL